MEKRRKESSKTSPEAGAVGRAPAASSRRMTATRDTRPRVARRQVFSEQSPEETVRRIRAEAEQASRRLKPLLLTISRRFCDPDFQVATLWKEHRITDKSAASWFVQEVGTSPRVYIENARLEVGAWLLSQTRFPLWKVAEESGYSSDSTFCRAFKRRTNITPERYRRSKPPPGAAADQELQDRIGCGLSGGLEPREGFSLLLEMENVTMRLRRLYDPHNLVPILVAGVKFETRLVESDLWPEIAAQPFDRQRLLVKHSRLATPVFYDFLHRKSREEGRIDRRHGVELAQLALESVEALGGAYPNLRAQARAWLGNARRLALDFLGADRDIEQAVKEVRDSSDLTSVGIVYWLKGTLRMTQRRQDEAIDSFETSYSAFQEQGDSEWMVKTLLHWAAALSYAEKHDAALQPLEEAEALLAPPREGGLGFLVQFAICLALGRADRFEQAQAHIEILKRARVDSDLWRCQIQWLDAGIDQGLGKPSAEYKLLSALDIVGSLDEPLYEALLMLDLAILYAEGGLSKKVIEVSGQVCAFFASLKLYDETICSLRLLVEAVSQTRVTTEVLKDFRACLRRDPLLEMGVGQSRYPAP